MSVARIVAIDPGTEKCGIAVVDRDAGVLKQQVAPTRQLVVQVTELLTRYNCRLIVVGNQTFSAAVRSLLQPLLDQNQADDVVLIDEKGSTEAARSRYWQTFPPDGWRRFLPLGLLVPPCAIDDFAAIILGERYFKKNI
jgi:RNase H-fold protein (predicted Holliday junction resolvase)